MDALQNTCFFRKKDAVFSPVFFEVENPVTPWLGFVNVQKMEFSNFTNREW